MKHLILWTILIVIFCSSCTKKKESTNSNIAKVDIYYVGWDIIHACPVGCDDFFGTFKNSKKKIEITDPILLRKLEKALSTLEKRDKVDVSMDAKIKIFVYKKNSNQYTEYCIDWDNVTDGKTNYLLSKPLYNLLKEIDVIDEL